ncbi:MAG TPA: hypothetical protein VFD82_05580 [Planctomycetota bacterium]|nr:hypothetical protein [Planctomycetota bacterium]
MNTATAASRPLQILAVMLGIAIAALFVAWVRVEPAMPADAAPAPTPRRGTDAPAPATAHLEPSAPHEAAPAAAPHEAPAGPTATAAVLFGTVKRADGTLVNDGYLWLDQKQASTASLRRGTFAFPGVQPGVHRLTSRIPDEMGIDREVTVQAPQTRFDIELAPKWLLTVNATTPDGKSLRESAPELAGPGQRNLRALAFAQPLTGDLVSSRSSEFEAGLGRFRANDPFFGRDAAKALPMETLGVLTLPPDQAVHVALLLGGTLIAQQPAAPGQEKVEFVLAADAIGGKTSTVTFRCLDPNGAPVAGARVSMSSGSGMSSGPKMVTDAEGRYTATKVLPGRFSFSVWHKELRMPPLETEIAPGAVVDLGDHTMQRGVELEISFAGSGGAGSASMYWLDAPRDSRWRSTDHRFSEQTGPTAKTSLFPGRYALLARGKSGVALLELDTNAMPPQPLRLPWTAPASLRVQNQGVATFVQFEIANARGLPVYRGEAGNRGDYDIPLPPGDYVATIRGSGGSVTKKDIRLPASGAVLTLP